jgi:hypothetical protein
MSDGDETAQVDYTSAACEIWRRAKENYPDLAQAAIDLPDVTFATRSIHSKDVADSEGVLVYTRSLHGYDRIGFAGQDDSSFRVGPHDALKMTACEPGEHGISRLHEHYELVKTVIEGPLATDELNFEGQLSGVRRRVYERLRSLISDSNVHLFSPDEASHEAVDALYRSPLTEYSKQALARAMRDRSSEDVLALVMSLHNEGRLTIDSVSDEDEVRIVCSMGFRKEV